ncbi:STAS domain-containing protein [Streptomyces sp. NPDC096013]|uniref:STAS domain-containing protein n=1 Tax=Streptomyces sp. NPDC096013 TaxID=3366069 RepID=UPI00380F64E1
MVGIQQDIQQVGQPGWLSVRTDRVDGVLVVTVAGEIDHETGGALREALDLPDGAAPRVVIDLGHVTFMDSSGINLLIAAHHTLEAGGWLRLAGAVPSVLRTIQLVGIDALIDCYPTLRQALGR